MRTFMLYYVSSSKDLDHHGTPTPTPSKPAAVHSLDPPQRLTDAPLGEYLQGVAGALSHGG